MNIVDYLAEIRTLAASGQATEHSYRPALERLLCGENKNDVVDVMINALIDQGVNTSVRIFGAAVRLDCNRAHVAIRLKGGIGVRWTRDSDGIYHNLV